MSRIDDWIARLEAGEPIDWRREAMLQALDVAKAGADFARDEAARDRAVDEQYQEPGRLVA